MSLSRRWAFARHIPPRQIAARLMLESKRRINERLRPALLPPADLVLDPNPPHPLFAPRGGKIERIGAGWRFTFLNRAIETGPVIDWSLPGPGPRDQLWRMNLHYVEWLEALDAAAGLPLIEQWIEANPPYARGYWRDSWNSYALSLRVVVWMQWLAREKIAPPRVIATVAAQLAFLERNLETDIGGNHLFKNIKALLWASAFFEGAAAARWRKIARPLLTREIERQILTDGMHYERSTSYHAQIFADLLEIRHATGDAGLDDVLERMAAPVARLAHPDGGPAQFSDAGLTMAYAPGECLALLPAVTGRPAPTRDGGFALTDAGYYGVHDDRMSLIADMGRIGPDDLPAHAHGDIGGFELSVSGHRMIVDQGVFEYVAGAKRQVSRAAASHNVLAVDGADQADFFGAFRCGRRPDVTIVEYRATGDGFVLEGGHDGYPGVVATRRFEVGGGLIRIRDRLSAPAPASVALLLHPACDARIAGATAHIARGSARLAITASHPLTIEPAVWWPDMGVELPTTRLRLTWPPDCLESALELAATVAQADI